MQFPMHRSGIGNQSTGLIFLHRRFCCQTPATIHDIATMMRKDAAMTLEIVGHTDSDRGARHRSCGRASRASNIDGNRLTSFGKGLVEPVVSNGTAAGKARNRRVELGLKQPHPPPLQSLNPRLHYGRG